MHQRDSFWQRALALLGVLGLATNCGPVELLDSQVPAPQEEPGQRQDEVVYGNDDRLDVYAHPDELLRARAHQSTVALVLASDLDTSDPDDVTYSTESLGSAYNLCPSERFLNDPTLANCTGTLIDDDLVLTAGHCIDTPLLPCDQTRFVFNYYRPSPTTLHQLTTDDIFSCESVVVREFGMVDGLYLDYAIVRLDRKATPRFTPAPVRVENTPLATAQSVAVIGSGSGVPLKLDTGGAVRNPNPLRQDFFTTTTDTFVYNSGSGVYDWDSHTVAGILARTTDLGYVDNGGCNVVNTCNKTGCLGEFAVYVHHAIQAYCDMAQSPRLCGSGSVENILAYEANDTHYATQEAVDRELQLVAGQTVLLGTCGLPGSFARGDTFLRLIDPEGMAVAANNDACNGLGSFIRYTVPAGKSGTYQLRAGCNSDKACGGLVAWNVDAFMYQAELFSPVQREFTLTEGQRLGATTCLPGAPTSGAPLLRLLGPDGNEVVSGDAGCFGVGSGSAIQYTVPEGMGGTYTLEAGCAIGECGGTVAWELTGGAGSFVYKANDTRSATTRTHVRFLPLSTGQELTVRTCGTPNAYTYTDTYLRLYGPDGLVVALNDDACGGIASSLTYTAPVSGIYQIHAGCYGSQQCSGTVSFSTQQSQGKSALK